MRANVRKGCEEKGFVLSTLCRKMRFSTVPEEQLISDPGGVFAAIRTELAERLEEWAAQRQELEEGQAFLLRQVDQRLDGEDDTREEEPDEDEYMYEQGATEHAEEEEEQRAEETVDPILRIVRVAAQEAEHRPRGGLVRLLSHAEQLAVRQVHHWIAGLPQTLPNPETEQDGHETLMNFMGGVSFIDVTNRLSVYHPLDILIQLVIIRCQAILRSDTVLARYYNVAICTLELAVRWTREYVENIRMGIEQTEGVNHLAETQERLQFTKWIFRVPGAQVSEAHEPRSEEPGVGEAS
ncbi:hypothetical protein B0T21DRAFT_344523 [Apiosordaria backusii]|uniref:Uncharacterized protein n=1 Tax=Apiosordaria backusii TaxID=314023 RepID=A0AA40K387_9PEZI|nr:hypothetical protein B0T21DRAFT_344523 [Apiosordaria backusii]